MKLFKDRKKTEGSERIKRGMGSFEEFEGSDGTRTVEQSPYSPDHYLTTKEYSIPSDLAGYEENLERHVQEFFEKARPDEFNCNFIDAELKSLEDAALSSLEMQRNEHIRGQLKCIEKTWELGKEDYTKKETILSRELEEVEHLIKMYGRILNEGTAFEE